jgi:hypothetical protein
MAIFSPDLQHCGHMPARSACQNGLQRCAAGNHAVPSLLRSAASEYLTSRRDNPPIDSVRTSDRFPLDQWWSNDATLSIDIHGDITRDARRSALQR